MSDRIIKTGLSKKYKDMLDSVLGQMSDGYWENTPMMRGYYKFCDIGTAGGEITIEVDEDSGARDGDRFIENRFYRMSDDAIKKFFADKIKFLIKEEGLGKWDRENERETIFLSYGNPRYRVKDCYYAYEILKGRNARKHPEYGDVVEANMKTNEGFLGELLEEVAQVTGVLTYKDAWRLDAAADDDKGFRKKVRDLLNDFEDAAYDGDEAEMENVAKKLKELADGDAPLMVVPLGESHKAKRESWDGWDDWEDIEGLENALNDIEGLTYELRSCVRGAKTHCKDWKALALYIKGLAANLDDAAELMAYKRDGDESANEAEEPVGELFDALKQALAGKGYKVSQFTSDKEFVGQEKPYDGISIENEDPNAYHKNPYRIVLDTDDNLFRIFFPHVHRKSVTGQLGSISGIVKFILRDLNLDESK